MEAYLGMVVLMPYQFEPMGWMYCDGRLLQISQYDALYSLLGTTYGGDGTTTFGLPDLRGRTPIGTGTRSTDGVAYNIGVKGGAETVTLAAAELPSHTHNVKVAAVAGDLRAPGAALLADATAYISGTDPTAQMSANSCGSAGGGQLHENRGPYLAVKWMICVEGIYPTRD